MSVEVWEGKALLLLAERRVGWAHAAATLWTWEVPGLNPSWEGPSVSPPKTQMLTYHECKSTCNAC